jgi:hypothetical protein
MSDKIAKLGIERDNDLMYYIKSDGNVWATPRKKPGQAKGKPKTIADTDLDLDYTRYIYFLDGDGDVARKERAQGGKRKSKTKAEKPLKGKKIRGAGPALAPVVAASAPRTRGGKKSPAQLDRDIEECIAKAKTKATGEVKGDAKGNGAKTATAGARRKRR